MAFEILSDSFLKSLEWEPFALQLIDIKDTVKLCTSGPETLPHLEEIEGKS